MADYGHFGGALVEQPLDALERQPDPKVVCDPAVDHRDVEVGAHQDPLAPNRGQVF
jgi:hypothetical protein